MGSFGRIELGTFGYENSICASPSPEGIRPGLIDWNKVPQVEKDTVLDDGTLISAGDRYLRYGTILLKITEGDSEGLFAEYDPNSSDGRQQLNRSEALILNCTIKESDQDSNIIMFEKGHAYKDRLLIGGQNQPSLEEFAAAFPLIRLLSD